MQGSMSLSRTAMRGHPASDWIPAFAGMTTLIYSVTEIIMVLFFKPGL